MATKSKTAKKTNKRQSIPRTTRKFQLRKNHAVDNHVAEILDYARSQRQEVTMIRDGVRLLWALQNNDIDVLFEMFPHLKPRVATTSGSGGGQSELAKEIAEQIVLLGGTPGYLMQSALPSPALPAPKASNLPPVPVAVAKQAEIPSADQMAEDFLNGMLGLF